MCAAAKAIGITNEATASQTRTPITDYVAGSHGCSATDIWSWWSNQHFNRPGKLRMLPRPGCQSKPFWFTELGCFSVDKGSNQPNVFHDPKSWKALCCFSDGTPDYLSSGATTHVALTKTSRITETATRAVALWRARPT
jgi:hypothetical protein